MGTGMVLPHNGVKTTMLITVKIAKVNTSVDFEVEQLPATSLQYAITYGLTQAINDAHASVQRKNFATDELFYAEVNKKADKRIEQLVSGNVPGSRAPADPNAAKVRAAMRLAESQGVDLGGVDPEALVKMLIKAAKPKKSESDAA